MASCDIASLQYKGILQCDDHCSKLNSYKPAKAPSVVGEINNLLSSATNMMPACIKDGKFRMVTFNSLLKIFSTKGLINLVKDCSRIGLFFGIYMSELMYATPKYSSTTRSVINSLNGLLVGIMK